MAGENISAQLNSLWYGDFAFTELPIGKLKDIVVIREKYLAASNAFVDAVFIPEPLRKTRTGAEILSLLTNYQKHRVKGFNKAYVEKGQTGYSKRH